MQWASNSNLNTSVILTFFIVWFWSEVAEYRTTKQFKKDVDYFMTAGDRFTRQDGNELREAITTNKKVMAAMHRRLEAVERRVEVLEAAHISNL